MDLSSDDVPTELLDLSAMSISALCACDDRQLEPSMSRVLLQLERPRKNMGSGPPGRFD